MEIFIINESKTKDIYRQICDFNSKKKLIGLSRDTAVVVGGEQLSKITSATGTQNEKILEEFFDLTRSASVVIACRVSPKQKAEVVRIVRRKEAQNNVTTLAIGDGANDVNMITAAHIGVGIRGLEGQQAARASDYSIGQFRFLKNLMFTHGREAYRRNSYLILYMFYKNVIYVLPIFYFGILSQFSGTPFYNAVMYQCYNVFFTGMPICWFCTFDWQYSKEYLLQNPRLYRIGLNDDCFSPGVFWFWYISAIWQGAVLLFLSFYTLDRSYSEQLSDLSQQFDFKSDKTQKKTISGSLNLNGVFIFQAIVVLVNIKLFLHSNTYSFFSILWQFGSIFLFYLFFSFFNTNQDLGLFGLLPILFSFENQYFLLFFFMTSYSLIEYGLGVVDKVIWNKQEHFILNQKIEKEEFFMSQISERPRKLTNYKHKGYGFDGAAG
mmetsp:Transcript_824/g.1479  ORF Transcript_824/g.1479 Transcript_824/m.1479 type:complete len:437 (+) Transcript_824:889-2199(+)